MKYMIKTLSLLVSAAFAISAFGQDLDTDAINICGARLTIGMELQAVMELVSRQCDSKPVDREAKMWKFYPLKGDRANSIGGVYFVAGKLAQISRHWSSGSDMLELAEGLYFAVRNFTRENRTTCYLTADQTDEPDVSFKRVTITCGRKNIIVVAGRGTKGFRDAGITENLE
jgi:hypothetical protein